MNDSAALGPVTGPERIQAMDVLRGFALLGILLMNIEAFAGPLDIAVNGLDPALAGADRVVDAIIYVLVQGKFYTLFSLLFGMGFAVMQARAQAAGRPFVALYLRRTLALLAIGLAHAVLLWAGDILTSYALVALVLLLFFRRHSGVSLVAAAIACLMVFPLLALLLSIPASLPMGPEAAAEFAESVAGNRADAAAAIEAQRLAFGSGSYADAVAQNLVDLRQTLSSLLFWGWMVLGMFLLGGWFVRSGAIAQPERFPGLYARLRLVALPLGLALTLASFALAPTLDTSRFDLRVGGALFLFEVGSVLMCLGYLAWVVRGLQSPGPAAILARLAPAGRMALTNYLGQTLACTWIFYHWGLGHFEQLPRAWQPLFVLALYAAQVALSRWWLQRFRFGPAEWLWRAATYLQWPPLRR